MSESAPNRLLCYYLCVRCELSNGMDFAYVDLRLSEERNVYVRRETRLPADLISELKQQRDELRLQLHLGGEDVKDEWEKLDDKLAQLAHRSSWLAAKSRTVSVGSERA